MENKDDVNIIKSIKNGDENAINFLIDKYKEFVFILAMRLLKNTEEAEDLAQEVFIKIFLNIHTFKGDSKLSTWIYTITYREGLNRIKKSTRRVLIKEMDNFDNINEVDEDDNALYELIKDENSAYIKDCIDSLGQIESTLLIFYYYEELSVKEICEITELTKSNVKVILFRARKQLKTKLQRTKILIS